ncbi:MAG: hypothetical protein IKO31_00215 [Bacteroidales bacterium]|nr:hypothetical protein [Bacteroidales bacterium]
MNTKLSLICAIYVSMFLSCGKSNTNDEKATNIPSRVDIIEVDYHSVTLEIEAPFLSVVLTDFIINTEEDLEKCKHELTAREISRIALSQDSTSDVIRGTIDGLQAGTTYYGFLSLSGEITAPFSFTTKDFTYKADAVDMGLSVKWSSMDLGANAPKEKGLRFAWGETGPKNFFTDWNSKWYRYSKDNIRGLTPGESYNFSIEDDAARKKLGGTWRVPTREEWQELLSNTTRQSINGQLEFTSKINGNIIYIEDTQKQELDNPCYECWSSTFSFLGTDMGANNSGAWAFGWSQVVNNHYYGTLFRDVYGGCYIRPVCD